MISLGFLAWDVSHHRPIVFTRVVHERGRLIISRVSVCMGSVDFLQNMAVWFIAHIRQIKRRLGNTGARVLDYMFENLTKICRMSGSNQRNRCCTYISGRLYFSLLSSKNFTLDQLVCKVSTLNHFCSSLNFVTPLLIFLGCDFLKLDCRRLCYARICCIQRYRPWILLCVKISYHIFHPTWTSPPPPKRSFDINSWTVFMSYFYTNRWPHKTLPYAANQNVQMWHSDNAKHLSSFRRLDKSPQRLAHAANTNVFH